MNLYVQKSSCSARQILQTAFGVSMFASLTGHKNFPFLSSTLRDPGNGVPTGWIDSSKLNYLDLDEVGDSYFTGWYFPTKVVLPCYPPSP